MEREPNSAERDIVKWDDGTHEIHLYNEDNGYGLTCCEMRIGPWDVWWVGEVTCLKCRRVVNEKKTLPEGPKEWFPSKNG